MTVKEVAAMLQLNEKTVHRFCAEGKLPYVRIGPQALRIRPAELEAWLDARSEGGR